MWVHVYATTPCCSTHVSARAAPLPATSACNCAPQLHSQQLNPPLLCNCTQAVGGHGCSLTCRASPRSSALSVSQMLAFCCSSSPLAARRWPPASAALAPARCRFSGSTPELLRLLRDARLPAVLKGHASCQWKADCTSDGRTKHVNSCERNKKHHRGGWHRPPSIFLQQSLRDC